MPEKHTYIVAIDTSFYKSLGSLIDKAIFVSKHLDCKGVDRVENVLCPNLKWVVFKVTKDE